MPPAPTGPRPVSSNQRGPHPRLPALVARHRAGHFQRPRPSHAARALEQIAQRRGGRDLPLVLDSGCGTGEHAVALARAHPDALVVAADRSAARLTRAARRAPPDNVLLLRVDLVDLWLGLAALGWPVAANYLLYPNPWPKQHHLARRWHAHPVMPTLLALGGTLELRTNWVVYAQEFAEAAGALTTRTCTVEAWQPDVAESAFERKYLAAGQPLYRVRCGAPA